MMFPSLLPAVLLCMSLQQQLGASPAPPFPDTDPITGLTLQCDRCPPGTFVSARCTATRPTVCSPCPTGSFTELHNYISRCLRCSVCGNDQQVKTECTAQGDCECECRNGFYKKRHGMCARHSTCVAGQQVLTQGTAVTDTVCETCPNGTFSDGASANQNCSLHSACKGEGQQLLLRGAGWHDSICIHCEQQTARDGAFYLKEIIPQLFVHQRMSFRQLRRVVQRLPVDSSSGLRLHPNPKASDLTNHIAAWVSVATATQVRQLPALLDRAGALGASDKLTNKLQRIDAHLARVCLSNEVR